MVDRRLAGPGVMLLSAGIFAYFGFMLAFPEIDPATGSMIPLVVTLKWTLRVTAIGFALAALLTMSAPRPGNILYAAVGLVSALMFLVVAVWDLASPFGSGVHWMLLVLFAAWNGFGSWSGLRESFGATAAGRRDEVA